MDQYQDRRYLDMRNRWQYRGLVDNWRRLAIRADRPDCGNAPALDLLRERNDPQ